MKAIFHRLRRLENAAAPAERERTAVEAILEARRRRLGADDEPIVYPPDWFIGCHGDADHINRAYEFLRKRPTDELKSELPVSQENTFR
jgi:hypothetical protein